MGPARRRFGPVVLALTILLWGYSVAQNYSAAASEKPEPSPANSRAEVAKGQPVQIGDASWYGSQHEGRKTASGEPFDPHALTAAHPTLPLDTKVRVTNLENGKTVDVRVNDRGPYVKRRVIDLSARAAEKIDLKTDGVGKVKIEPLKGTGQTASAHPQ